MVFYREAPSKLLLLQFVEVGVKWGQNDRLLYFWSLDGCLPLAVQHYPVEPQFFENLSFSFWKREKQC